MRHPLLPFHYAHTHPYSLEARRQCTHNRLKHAPHARTHARTHARRGGGEVGYRLPSQPALLESLSLFFCPLSLFFFIKSFWGFRSQNATPPLPFHFQSPMNDLSGFGTPYRYATRARLTRILARRSTGMQVLSYAPHTSARTRCSAHVSRTRARTRLTHERARHTKGARLTHTSARGTRSAHVSHTRAYSSTRSAHVSHTRARNSTRSAEVPHKHKHALEHAHAAQSSRLAHTSA